MNAQTRPLPPHVPGLPRSATAARIVRSAPEAIAVAHELAAVFRAGAAARDRDRLLPFVEVDLYSQSGLWAINVPRSHGGPELRYATIAEVIRIISAADPSLGQITQNHLGIVAAIRTAGTPAQKTLFFNEVLGGLRFGNAFSELGTKRAAEFTTTIRRDGDDFVVRGRKFYSSGALLAHKVPIVALDEAGRAVYAIAERDAPGLTIIDDWSSFGQRTTASGTVVIDDVRVPADHVVAGYLGFENPSADGPIFQIIQAAVDAGIAAEALADTIAFVRDRSRPWIDAGVARNADDPHVIAAIGNLRWRLSAAEALLECAGHAIDRAVADPTEQTVGIARIRVAESKIATTEIALAASNTLFELAGTRATLAEHDLDRHWRNARTHTLHDPVRWKIHAVGNHALNDILPPAHAWS